MSRFMDLTGQKFGRLTVQMRGQDYQKPSGGRHTMWVCLCDCGKTTTTAAYRMRDGTATSCGCFSIELLRKRSVTHGKSHTKIHDVWLGMRRRCENPNDNSYADYGARGIRVCERWQSFDRFYEDMGDAPIGMSIERKDNNGNYEPGNCRWATQKEQQRNKRSNHLVSIDGETLCLTTWSERSGVKQPTIRDRLRRGWNPTRAVFQSVR